jgi:hypothetical protein
MFEGSQGFGELCFVPSCSWKKYSFWRKGGNCDEYAWSDLRYQASEGVPWQGCDGIVCGDREPAGMCYFVRAISECIHCV